MATLNFNCNDAPKMDDFSPIPDGKYNAVIIESDLVGPNEKGTVQLKLVWKITSGQYEGRQVTAYFTYKCANATAEEIGHRQIGNVGEAVGVPYIGDTEELHGREHIISVGTAKPNTNGKVYNEIKRCYPLGGAAAAVATPTPSAAPATVAAAAAVPQPAAPANNTKPFPWGNKK